MNNINQLNQHINQKEWMNISKEYASKFLAENLSFIDALILSRLLLENEDFDDTIQIFAIELIKSIKEFHKEQWEGDWRHEAYLGYAYGLPGWFHEGNREINPSWQRIKELIFAGGSQANCQVTARRAFGCCET